MNARPMTASTSSASHPACGIHPLSLDRHTHVRTTGDKPAICFLCTFASSRKSSPRRDSPPFTSWAHTPGGVDCSIPCANLVCNKAQCPICALGTGYRYSGPMPSCLFRTVAFLTVQNYSGNFSSLIPFSMMTQLHGTPDGKRIHSLCNFCDLGDESHCKMRGNPSVAPGTAGNRLVDEMESLEGQVGLKSYPQIPKEGLECLTVPAGQHNPEAP